MVFCYDFVKKSKKNEFVLFRKYLRKFYALFFLLINNIYRVTDDLFRCLAGVLFYKQRKQLQGDAPSLIYSEIVKGIEKLLKLRQLKLKREFGYIINGP